MNKKRILACTLIGIMITSFGLYGCNKQNKSKESPKKVEKENNENSNVDKTKAETKSIKTGDSKKSNLQDNKVSLKQKTIKGKSSVVKYPFVSGISDKNIEDKINKTIESEAKNLLDYSEGRVDISYKGYSLGNEYLSIGLKGYATAEGGKVEMLNTINYDLSTGKALTTENFFKNDKESLEGLNNLFKKYSNGDTFSTGYGFFIKSDQDSKDSIVFYHLKNDADREFTRVEIPMNEIEPYLVK
ncbi:hypothetical protein CLPU_31c00010 [Gottschalkia purinilytica]|uniref:Lipoprotein n=1 Tax=Gottschalkia purinilytica TaxID=1503 RepID=A0A0L0W678_GOTPU|nr:hypothetical protein [Gottschalkia purinilytica]KNF07024.1 hypothetical protein CLPU_31c00010 [Gottschalkia purinilytica]